MTVHWNGPAVPEYADPLRILQADAHYHISNRGWDGISYHDAIWRDGTVYQCRDADAVLYHCGSLQGNATSRAVQMMIGEDQSPTPEMLEALGRLCGVYPKVYPHRYWSSTKCPGDELAAWVEGKGWDMAFADDPDAIAYREDVKNTIEAIKSVLARLDHHKHEVAQFIHRTGEPVST